MRKLCVADLPDKNITLIIEVTTYIDVSRTRTKSHVFTSEGFLPNEFSWSDATFEPVPDFNDLLEHNTLNHDELLLLKATWRPINEFCDCRFMVICEGCKWIITAPDGATWYVTRNAKGYINWERF